MMGRLLSKRHLAPSPSPSDKIGFEEAMRLSVALQSAVLRPNTYNRAKTNGKQLGLCLSMKTVAKAISVIEINVKPAAKPADE